MRLLVRHQFLHHLQRGLVARRQVDIGGRHRRHTRTPADQVRGHGQPGAEGRDQHQRMGFDAPRFKGFHQCHRRGGRAHIAVLVDGEEYLVHRRARALGDGFDDTQIGLVRHDDFHFVDRHAGLFHDIETALAHAGDRLLEYLLSVKIPARIAEVHADVGIERALAAHAQGLAGIGKALQFLRDDTFLVFSGFKHAGGGAVAKQDGYIAILPVHEFGYVFNTDHQHFLRRARLDERRGSGHAIEKAGACGIHVHRGRPVRSQSRLQARGGIRHVFVETATAVDNEIELVGFHAGAGERP